MIHKPLQYIRKAGKKLRRNAAAPHATLAQSSAVLWLSYNKLIAEVGLIFCGHLFISIHIPYARQETSFSSTLHCVTMLFVAVCVGESANHSFAAYFLSRSQYFISPVLDILIFARADEELSLICVLYQV